MRKQEKQFEALKNLADLSGELLALGLHGMANRVAEQTGALAEQSEHSVREAFEI